MDSPTDNGQKSLEQWRHEIDILDAELLRLLNKRAEIASELGALKVSSGLPVYDGRRERQILARLSQTNPGPLDQDGIASIFRCIIRESRRVERNSQPRLSQANHSQANNGDKSQFKQAGQEQSHGH
jgi:chorismate mutase/prephenate dehydratase